MTEVLETNVQEKACTKCGLIKDLASFYRDDRKKDGTHSWCKSCVSRRANDWNTKNRQRVKATKYSTDFEALWLTQAGLCAVCSEPMLPAGKSPKSVVVDHDHRCCHGDRSCGKCVRGLVHNECNRVLGSARDSTSLLQKAAAYLLRWQGGLT